MNPLVTHKFFDLLIKLYSPDVDENGKWIDPLAVKFYCQPSTFSYEIYDQENAFTGIPTKQSKIYYYWNDFKTMQEIISDIQKDLGWNISSNI